MINRKEARLRRARQTRAKLAELNAVRLSVHRTNQHIYAQVISTCGSRVLASASTLEPELRASIQSGGNIAAAKVVGMLVAQRAKAAGIERVSFDRAGFKYHGRVKALADAAREGGLKF